MLAKVLADTAVAGGEGACVSVCVSVSRRHQAVQRQVARVNEGRTGQQLRPTAGAERQSYRLSGSGRKTGAVGLWSLAVRRRANRSEGSMQI